MREIKFRCWNKKFKEMYYSENMRLTFSNVVNRGFDVAVIKKGTSICFVSEILELMQYTGLKDKNGKEIYEGDILEMLRDVYYKGGRCTVIYNDKKARFEVDKSLGFNHKSLSENIDRGFTVVGNLFENPSLLENK